MIGNEELLNKRINPYDPQKREYDSAIDEINKQIGGYNYELNQEALNTWYDDNFWDIPVSFREEAKTLVEFNGFFSIESYEKYLNILVYEAFVEIRHLIAGGNSPYEKLSISLELNSSYKNKLILCDSNSKKLQNQYDELAKSKYFQTNIGKQYIIDNGDYDDEIIDLITFKLYSYIQVQYNAISELVKFIDTQYDILILIIPTYKTDQELTAYQLLTEKYEIQKKSIKQNLVESKTIILPENFSLPRMNLTISKLDIRQTALLFYYLREFELVLKYNDDSLVKIICALTGHSEQNIRTKKGFGIIQDIKRDIPDTKTRQFKEVPNYNLNVLRSVLNEIIEEIDEQTKKNLERDKK
jgi:hypothetical protein